MMISNRPCSHYLMSKCFKIVLKHTQCGSLNPGQYLVEYYLKPYSSGCPTRYEIMIMKDWQVKDPVHTIIISNKHPYLYGYKIINVRIHSYEDLRYRLSKSPLLYDLIGHDYYWKKATRFMKPVDDESKVIINTFIKKYRLHKELENEISKRRNTLKFKNEFGDEFDDESDA